LPKVAAVLYEIRMSDNRDDITSDEALEAM
jgi:hypothetical protein